MFTIYVNSDKQHSNGLPPPKLRVVCVCVCTRVRVRKREREKERDDPSQKRVMSAITEEV